jgi:hypothetical protein
MFLKADITKGQRCEPLALSTQNGVVFQLDAAFHASEPKSSQRKNVVGIDV